MQSALLWQSYTESGDLLAREQLLTAHLGLVHHVARKMSRKLNADANFDELVSAGSVGLMNALESFDASRGLAFSTYAAPRIRGAILDELRRQDHVPRSVRRKTRDLASAADVLTQQLGRAPDQREVAEHLDVDLKTLWRWQSEVEGIFPLPLDTPVHDRDMRGTVPADFLAGEDETEIEERVNRGQEVEHLQAAIAQLNDQERTVLSLYYFEDLKLHEIGGMLELTESRVSQIRSKAVAKLRLEMAPLRTFDA